MQLKVAERLIPQEWLKSVPVLVFATAGMRLVDPDAAKVLYDRLLVGLVESDFPFDSSALRARTISGHEEGLFALLAANYLSGRLDLSLEARGNLIGVLDLGGSSTQIAVPPVVSRGAPVIPQLTGGYIQSFLSLGMERMRLTTYSRIVEAAGSALTAKLAVPNPCAFFGYIEESEPWRGTGSAVACEREVQNTLALEREQCLSDAEEGCLPGEHLRLPTSTNGDTFRLLMISGYLYVTDFAGWWLEKPGTRPASSEAPSNLETYKKPTIAELRAAAEVLCAEPWDRISDVALDQSRMHRYTAPNKVPHRCFELNYIITLLSEGFGFDPRERLFDIVDEVNGNEIEWTLGALLHHQATHVSDAGVLVSEL
jgi:hypothetical protein